MVVLHNNANRDFMHLIWKMYYYELVTGMEKDIHVSHKGQAAATNREKGQGVTRTRAGAAPCKNGLARTLYMYVVHATVHILIFFWRITRPNGTIFGYSLDGPLSKSYPLTLPDIPDDHHNFWLTKIWKLVLSKIPWIPFKNHVFWIRTLSD